MKRLGSRWVLFLLIVIAAILRLSLISSSRFTGDEAIFYQAAVQIHDGTAFPELGPAVTGGLARHPGPLFYYVMSVSQFFSRTPEAANAEVAILGALSVGFLWIAVESLLGGFPAFLAALLMTFSPWSILFADRIWNANVIIFLVAVAFWAAVRVYKNPKSPLFSLLIALCMVMPQFHLSVPVVWLALFVMILPRFKEWSWRWIGVGLILGGIAYLPYLHSEIVSGFANMRALQAENLHLQGHRQFYKVPIYAFKFFTLDTTYHELMGYWGGLHELTALKAAFLGSPVRPFNLLRLFGLISSIVLAGMIYFSAYRERKYLGIFWRAFLTGIVANMVLLAITPKPFYPHYLTPMLPFFFALVAGLAHRMERGIQEETQSSQRRQKWIGVLLVIFCIGGVEASVSISRGLDLRNGLSTQHQVIELILADARQEQWPPRTQVGLRFGFPAYLEGYSVLLAEIYHSQITVGQQGQSFAPGAPAPEYALMERPPGFDESGLGTSAQNEGGKIHFIGSNGLLLYRIK